MFSIHLLISSFPSLFSWSLGIVQAHQQFVSPALTSVPIIIVITISLRSHCFLSSLARFRNLSFFSLSFIFTLWNFFHNSQWITFPTQSSILFLLRFVIYRNLFWFTNTFQIPLVQTKNELINEQIKTRRAFEGNVNRVLSGRSLITKWIKHVAARVDSVHQPGWNLKNNFTIKKVFFFFFSTNHELSCQSFSEPIRSHTWR